MDVNQRRKTGKIDRLPIGLKDEVEHMLVSGISYREIVEYLKQNDVSLSRQAVCTYAKKFLATTQMLHIAQENFRMMSDEINSHPDLDTTEGIIRIMSNFILNALANTSPEEWQSAGIESLMKEANSLVRVVGYKRRVDQQNKTDVETALDANQALFTDVLKRSHPELYTRVIDALRLERERLKESAP